MSEPTYAAEFTAAARKQLAKAHRAVQLRVVKATLLLAREPRPPAARRLKASTELWRLRVGEYRVVYSIDGQKILVTIVRLGHRSDVYRRLDEL